MILWLAVLPVRAVLINGRDYLPLKSWAAENGFRELNDGLRDRMTLTNRATRLIFEKNSVTAMMDGVNLRLGFPIAVDKAGAFYIARLDTTKTLAPLIFSPPPAAKKITTICLDAGHGGKDVGYAVGKFFKHYEKNYTLALTLELRDQLRKAGFNVVLTREKDVYVDRSARPDIANRRGASLFVSLHFNCFPADPSGAQGPETYCITPVGMASSNDSEGVGAGHGGCPANRFEDQSLRLAYQIQRALVGGLGATDRSVRRARWEVLRSATMPAVLIEGGYMSHPVEGKKIFSTAYRKQMAAAIVKGILNYQKLTAPPSPRRT